MENFDITSPEGIAYAVFAVLAVVVAFFIIKKVASCLVKAVVMAIILAVMAYIYVTYIDAPADDEATTDVVEWGERG